MEKKIFITRKIPDIAAKMLQEKGYSVDINEKDKVLSKSKLIFILNKKHYDAALTLLTDKIDKEVFEKAPSVRIFSNFATGFDNIDLNEAKSRGVTVTNAPAPLTPESVAEHTFALMFALAKKVMEGDRFTRAGKYKGWEPMGFLGGDVSGKTLGLVGAGRIGQRLAELAKAMDMSVIYTDVNRNSELEEKCGAEYMASIKDLLPKADFVSLHVPLLPSTHHLINEDNLRLMKPSAYLVNTSRGPVIDEKALERVLQKKMLAGAGLDVYEFEPKVTPGLRKMNNTILTPHIASASATVRDQMAKISAQNIIDFFEGRMPKYALD